MITRYLRVLSKSAKIRRCGGSMAISFPMPWQNFAGLLPIQSAPWHLKRFEQVTYSGSSTPEVSELADPRWTVKVRLDLMAGREATDIQALFDLHGSGHPFHLHDPERMAPRLDPTGAVLGNATPTVATVSANGIALAGLPAGYTLSRGDLISIEHGAPGRRGAYALSETVTANAAGVTPVFVTSPRARIVTQTGQSVDLMRPTALMIVVPGSFQPGETVNTIRRDMTFDAVEAH